MNGPRIKRKRRPKREVITGFKMSYRYKCYMQDDIVEEDENEDLEIVYDRYSKIIAG